MRLDLGHGGLAFLFDSKVKGFEMLKAFFIVHKITLRRLNHVLSACDPVFWVPIVMARAWPTTFSQPIALAVFIAHSARCFETHRRALKPVWIYPVRCLQHQFTSLQSDLRLFLRLALPISLELKHLSFGVNTLTCRHGT